jgi:hypothetical protein
VGGIIPEWWAASSGIRKCVPAAAEIGFEPSAEIHWGIVERHADIAEVAGAVARRNVHAAAQRDREVSEVPAHAASLVMNILRRLGRAGVGVAENDAIVDIVADRIHQL